MPSPADVAVIGAGPYGLSVAAHLRQAGHDVRVFGRTMDSWRRGMPTGMKLKSAFASSSLSDPRSLCTLESFCRSRSIQLGAVDVAVPLEVFVAYGEWFQRNVVPEVLDVKVTRVRADRAGFRIDLDGDERLHARSVIMATGIGSFAHVPAPIAGLPPGLWCHSSAPGAVDRFANDVTVIGGGQSALETAALLREEGISVRLLVRQPRVRWNGAPNPAPKVRDRLLNPDAALGPGWPNWAFSNLPGAYRRLPVRDRVRIARTALGPAGAWWLRDRVEGCIPISTGVQVVAASPVAGGVRLTLRDADGHHSHLTTGYVVAATGYRPCLDDLPVLDVEIRRSLRRTGSSPALDRYLQSSIPGLYFVGASAANTFGPLMRFVAGAEFAARQVTASRSREARAVTAVRPVAPLPRVSMTNNSRHTSPWGSRRLPILMYHGVGRVDSDPHQLWVTPERFDSQMSWLRRRGLRGVSLSELCDAAAAGDAGGLFAITFDDGYANVLTDALPILVRHHFNATIFAIAGLLGGTNVWDGPPRHRLLTGGDLNVLQAHGVEIGSHGMTHTPLAGASGATLLEEATGSRQLLADLLGAAPRSFAYPYGSLDHAAIAAVRAAGYDYACAVKRTTRDGDARLRLRRVYIGERDRVPHIELKMLLATT
jgi:FAD-dependent urate hydroxylase